MQNIFICSRFDSFTDKFNQSCHNQIYFPNENFYMLYFVMTASSSRKVLTLRKFQLKANFKLKLCVEISNRRNVK